MRLWSKPWLAMAIGQLTCRGYPAYQFWASNTALLLLSTCEPVPFDTERVALKSNQQDQQRMLPKYLHKASAPKALLTALSLQGKGRARTSEETKDRKRDRSPGCVTCTVITVDELQQRPKWLGTALAQVVPHTALVRERHRRSTQQALRSSQTSMSHKGAWTKIQPCLVCKASGAMLRQRKLPFCLCDTMLGDVGVAKMTLA